MPHRELQLNFVKEFGEELGLVGAAAVRLFETVYIV